jgi:hypothetical protein
MDNKKILLVNLSKGRLGELNSKLLGMIFVMKFQAAAMDRANVPEDERQDFALYVDEFQNFSTDSFATILSEARKYRLNLIVANQFTTQLTEEIRDAVFGNVGTIISFRVGTADAEFLAKQFAPVFDMDDLQRIPNRNTIVRMLIGGVPTQPFSMAMLPPLGKPNKELSDALRQLSAAKYGRPRAIVEKEIFARIASPATPARSSGPTPSQGAPQAPSKPSTGSSFLDDWLAKKQTNNFKVPSTPFNPPANATPVGPQSSLTPIVTAPMPLAPAPITSSVDQQATVQVSVAPQQPLEATVQPQAVSITTNNAQPVPEASGVAADTEQQSSSESPRFSTSGPIDHTVKIR